MGGRGELRAPTRAEAGDAEMENSEKHEWAVRPPNNAALPLN